MRRNECGGTALLDATPGTPCGTCGAGVVLCVDENTTACFGGGLSARNECGGCETLLVGEVPFDDVPGAPCGVCNSGSWVCAAENSIECLGESAATLRTYYADRDGDGFGSTTEQRQACSPPLGFVENNRDCDDLDDRVAPGFVELCDGRDNNCNGIIDEDFVAYVDADRDGFGDVDAPIVACSIQTGISRLPTDCDDTNASIFPGQTLGFAEARDDGSYDYNCDGIDEPTLLDIPVCENPPLCGTDGFTFPLQGWASRPAPGCGSQAPWILSCRLTLDGCTSTVDETPRRQLCR